MTCAGVQHARRVSSRSCGNVDESTVCSDETFSSKENESEKSENVVSVGAA